MVPVGMRQEPGLPADGRWAGEPPRRHAAGGREIWAQPRAGSVAESTAAEQLDRLGCHLAMAGLRLARLRARLESTEDRLMLIQARYDLDEAIAEVRRLALSARQREGS